MTILVDRLAVSSVTTEARKMLVLCRDELLDLRVISWRRDIEDLKRVEQRYCRAFRHTGHVLTMLGLSPRGPLAPGGEGEMARRVSRHGAWAHVSWIYVLLDAVKVHAALSLIEVRRGRYEEMSEHLDWIHDFPMFAECPDSFSTDVGSDPGCRAKPCLMHRVISDGLVSVHE